MRSRRSSQEHVAEVARRRLELLSAELAAIRPDPVDPPVPGHRDGSGELLEPYQPSESSEPPDVAPARPARPAVEPAPVAGPGRHAHRPVGVGASVAGWAQDRLPPTVQGRVRLTGAHLAVVVAVVVAGVALTAWWTARASGGETALPPVPAVRSAAATPASSGSTPASAPGTPGAAATAPAAGAAAGGSPGSQIVVDVTGKVHHPGIATLPSGSRVADALQAAGGPRRGASLASLNLARVLADGEQVVVGVRAPPGVAASAAGAGMGVGGGVGGGVGAAGGAATPGTMVNINTADQTLLESLPGVGPVTARSILDYRAEKGGFTSVDELLEVSGIGDATLAKISPYCTL